MRQWWTLHHSEEHREIVQAIKAQKSLNLVVYMLSPYNERDENGWLVRHQQAHNDFNNALGLTGTDLQNLDPEGNQEEIAMMHFREHQAARQALGI